MELTANEIIAEIRKILGNSFPVYQLEYHRDRVSRGIQTKNHEIDGLGLSNCYTPKLAPILEKIDHIKELDLSNNRFSNVPNAIKNMTQLKILNLSGNSLTEIPPVLRNFPELRFLDLHTNNFETISSTRNPLIRLKNIFQLDLSNNPLRSVDYLFTGNAYLKGLHLARNRLTSVPPLYFHNRSLEIMDLGLNSIQALPEDIDRATSIRFMYLDRNLLTTLPESIRRMRWLAELNLSGNRFTSIPLQLVDSCAPIIRPNGPRPTTAVVNLEYNPLCRRDKDFLAKLSHEQTEHRIQLFCSLYRNLDSVLDSAISDRAPISDADFDHIRYALDILYPLFAEKIDQYFRRLPLLTFLKRSLEFTNTLPEITKYLPQDLVATLYPILQEEFPKSDLSILQKIYDNLRSHTVIAKFFYNVAPPNPKNTGKFKR